MNSAAGVQTTAAAAQTHGESAHAMALQTIAHELRQPLSAIESIAYYLNLVLPRDDRRLREQASRLQDLVEQSNWILTCGLQLFDETPLAPEPVDLDQLITLTATARSSHHNPRPDLQLASGLRRVQMDPSRGRALIENLFSLFEHLSRGAPPVRLATAPAATGVCLTLTARVPGYRTESSFGPSCCLSLASARRIVEAHHGSFDLEVNPVSGIVLNVVLP